MERLQSQEEFRILRLVETRLLRRALLLLALRAELRQLRLALLPLLEAEIPQFLAASVRPLAVLCRSLEPTRLLAVRSRSTLARPPVGSEASLPSFLAREVARQALAARSLPPLAYLEGVLEEPSLLRAGLALELAALRRLLLAQVQAQWEALPVSWAVRPIVQRAELRL